jgi:hypothetical protein
MSVLWFVDKVLKYEVGIFFNYLENIKMDWNTICITQNFLSYEWNAFVNGKFSHSTTLEHNSSFLNELAKPFTLGKDYLFWGQITDFNIWNRPLSFSEINEYSLNCKEDFSQKSKPELFTWSNDSIKERGNNTQYFLMSRSLLTSYNSSGIKQSQISQYFENVYYLEYLKSLQFCHFLSGDLLHLNSTKLGNIEFHKPCYWVPIIKSNNENTTRWKFDQRALNSSDEISFPIKSGLGFDNKLCLSFEIAGHIYIPLSCENNAQPSFCQVPAEGLMFTAVSNSTSICSFEEKFFLLSENSAIFLIGLYGKLILKNLGYTWVILENNFSLKIQQRIGEFLSVDHSLRVEIDNVIGIHQIECNNPETNGTLKQYFRISNVSRPEALMVISFLSTNEFAQNYSGERYTQIFCWQD